MSRKKREKRARARQDANPSRGSVDAPAKSEAESREPPKSRSLNRLGVIVAIGGLVGLFALVLILGDPPPPVPRTDSAAAEESDEPERSNMELWQAALPQEVPVLDRDFSLGPADAPVTIIEFSDFECPFCRGANDQLREVAERYPSDVRLVFKNFPLDMACNADVTQQVHPYGCKAAVMARCASDDDPERFWRFHDALFSIRDFSDEALDMVAADMGVNDESFWSCVSAREVFEEVRNDVALARSLGVEYTPTVYVNNRVAPSYQADELSEIIDHILANK